MKDAFITWDLPSTREDGTVLTIDDLKHVEVYLSADLGANFGLVNTFPVKNVDGTPAPRELTIPQLEEGDWVLQFIVQDIGDRRGKPHNVPFVVRNGIIAPPGKVVNVQVTLS